MNVVPFKAGEIVAEVLINGDLSRLTDEQCATHYVRVCETLGLNPYTRPFEYLRLGGKKVLYARRDATDQLRTIHNVSVEEVTETERDGVFIVTAKVRNEKGRTDCAKGAVNISGLKGDNLANALMKAETKAKRRATLSLCGLGWLDETEIETIPEAKPEKSTGEFLSAFARLRQEIDLAPDLSELKEWGRDNAEVIRAMPRDWQDQLRSLYAEQLGRLRDPEPVPAVNDLPDIPAFLDRRVAV